MKHWIINKDLKQVQVSSMAPTKDLMEAKISASNHGYELVTVMVAPKKTTPACNCHTNAQMGVCEHD